MIYKLYQSVIKEILLLKRDLGGVIILFIMPLVLIITVTLIQDNTFKKISDAKIPILLVDNDKGQVSQSVFENLKQSNAFNVITKFGGNSLTEEEASEAVFKGKYQLAIVIPKDLSADLQVKIDQNVDKILSNFGLSDSIAAKQVQKNITQKQVKLYFDPAVQLSFKNAVMNSIDKMISQIESKSIYAAFQEQLGESELNFEQKNFISFKEIIPRINDKEIIPN
jgi:ABC-2 type transport system permease protein